MNKIIAAIATIAVLMLGILAIAHFAEEEAVVENVYNTGNGDVFDTSDPNAPVNGFAVRGTVVAVDLEQAMFDGPYVLLVRETNGDEVVIAVPSMGIMLCAGRANIANVSDIKEGMTVEAKGALTAQGDIVPCESESHYLRVVTR